METIYKTTTISDRHIRRGACEDGDFGEIVLVEASEQEAPLICNIKDYKINQTLRLFQGSYYSDFDRWNNKFFFAEKQGRLTKNTALTLMVEERKQTSSSSFYPAHNAKYIIVGRRIYREWCKKADLKITQTGNTLFGDWWSLDVEPYHVNKSNISFSKKNFDRILAQRKKWIAKKNKNRATKIYFSYPKIKWFGDCIDHTERP